MKDDPQKAAWDHFRRGEQLFAHGDPKAAGLEWDAALSLDPRHLGALVQRSLLRFTGGNFEGAAADYELLLQEAPPDFPLRRAAELLLEEATRRRRVAPEVPQVEPLTRFAEEVRSRGLDSFRNGDFQAAIFAFDAVLWVRPKDDNALFNRGNARGAMGDLDGAIADFTELLSLGMDYEALFRRAQAHEMKGNVASATDDLEYAIEHAPFTWLLRMRAAEALTRLKEPQREMMERGLTSPSEVWVEERLGRMFHADERAQRHRDRACLAAADEHHARASEFHSLADEDQAKADGLSLILQALLGEPGSLPWPDEPSLAETRRKAELMPSPWEEAGGGFDLACFYARFPDWSKWVGEFREAYNRWKDDPRFVAQAPKFKPWNPAWA